MSHPSHVLGDNTATVSELPLLRSALLYADSMELISPLHSMMHVGHAVEDATPRYGEHIVDPATGILRAYLARDRFPGRHYESWDVIDQTIANAGIPPGLSEEELRKALRQAFRDEDERNAREWKERDDRRGYTDIKRLLDTGLVTIAADGLGNAPINASFGPETWLSGWWEQLHQRMESGDTRLLLDDESRREVDQALRKGLVEPGALFQARGGEAMLGSGLIARLPAFPTAPVDELLNLRADLSGSLTRYRSAVARLAKESQLTIRPETPALIDDIWGRDVAPAIASITEQMHDHGLVRELADAAGQDIATFLTKGAALGVGLGTFTDISAWVGALIGVAAPSAQAAYVGWRNSARGRAAARRSDLFYLYEADRRLSG